MDFETPWDSLDLDLVLVPRAIPRLRLPAPSTYLSILPSRKGHENWAEKWSKADTASKMRAIADECLEYERQVIVKANILKLSKPSPVADGGESTPQKQVSSLRGKPIEDLTSRKSPSTAPNQSTHLSRKRARASIVDDGLYYVPKAKRVKFKEFTERESTGNNIPASTPVSDEPGTKAGSTAEDEDPTADHSTPELISSDDPDPVVSLVDLHNKVFEVVNAWHKLVIQAEGIEDNLYAIQTNPEVTVSSLDQSVMSEEQLEERLAQMQILGVQMMADLDEAALVAKLSFGLGSPPMDQFQAEDRGKSLEEDYDLDIEVQLKVHGIFGWWMVQISGEL